MKTKIIILVLILVAGGLGIWYWQNGQTPSVTPPSSATASSVIYKNNQYGFSIALPDGWKGYTVLNSQWEGRDTSTGNVVVSGPIITLRHPQWTKASQREDMPVMIFTLAQWALIDRGNISLGAAPVAPTILGQNSKYLLALPARYNFDSKTGWEEVDQLVHNLKAFEPTQ